MRLCYLPCRMTIRKRVTLKDIAAEAGVHHTTVSMALRNRPELPEQTRERIQQIALRLGYRPDPMLRALRSYRSDAMGDGRRGFSIAFVTAFETPEFWRRIPVYSRRYDGITARASQLGYNIEHFWIDLKKMDARRTTQILRARNISGLIIAPIKVPSMLPLQWQWFACVSLTFSLQSTDMHVISNNHLHTFRLAWRSLLERGYRRPALVVDRVSDERVLHVWSTVALGEVSRMPVGCRVRPYVPEVLQKDGFTRWFRRYRPDAIVTISPHLNILEWLRQEGCRVPAEVGFANLDCEEPVGGASGVYQLPEVIGMTSVDVLSGLIQRNDLGLPQSPQSILIRGAWVDGNTTRPLLQSP